MDTEMKFAWIPPGGFLMGGAESGEQPKHRVDVSKGFFLGVHPVTQAQWKSVMGFNPAHFVGDENRPVESITWFEAVEYCQKLGKQTNWLITLPTEAEWEYACRAGTGTEYHTGNGEEALKKAGWYQANSKNTTQPVGKLAANDWNLQDMHGNVWEWCLDGKRSYTADHKTDHDSTEG